MATACWGPAPSPGEEHIPHGPILPCPQQRVSGLSFRWQPRVHPSAWLMPIPELIWLQLRACSEAAARTFERGRETSSGSWLQGGVS